MLFTVYVGLERFIYVSRVSIPEFQRIKAEPLNLYQKTEDVILVQHNDQIMEFLEAKVPTGTPMYELFWS